MPHEGVIFMCLLVGWFPGSSFAQVSVVESGLMCPYGWKLNPNVGANGTCFQAFHSEAANWSEALRTCRQHDGFLLKATEELKYKISDLLSTEELRQVWTGLHVHPRTGKLLWDEIGAVVLQSSDIKDSSVQLPDQPFSPPVMSWSGGQPNMTSGECVLAAVTFGTQISLVRFSLHNCSNKHKFICQRAPILTEVEKGGQCFQRWYGGIYLDKCYSIFTEPLRTHSSAKQQCSQIVDGENVGTLVSPSSAFVEGYIKNMIDRDPIKQESEIGFWTGLKYNTSARDYFWEDGTAVNRAMMSTSSLNWTEGKNCGIIFLASAQAQSTLRWKWADCNQQAYTICELPKRKEESPQPRLLLNTSTGVKSGGKNEYGGDKPVEVPKSQLNFKIENLRPRLKTFFLWNWERVFSNVSMELQGYYFHNIWELHPLKKKSTNRILIVHPNYLTFRGRLNISELFTLQELSVTKFNLFQHPLQLDNSFQPLIDSLGRLSNRVLELGGWERVELTLRRFSYEGTQLMAHFNAIVKLRSNTAERLEATVLRNFTEKMKTALREEVSRMELRIEDVDRVVGSLEVLPTRKCVAQRDMSSVGLPAGLPGEIYRSAEICEDSGEPTLIANCTGDFYDGLKWVIVSQTKCNSTKQPSIEDILDDLEKKEVNSDTAFNIADSLANISRNTGDLLPEVIIKITAILEKIVNQETVDTKAGGRVCLTIDNVMKVDPAMLMKSQMTNSTSTRLAVKAESFPNIRILMTLEKYTERALLGGSGNQRQTYRALALEMWNVQNSTRVNGIRYLQVDAPPGGANEGFDWFSNQTFQTITGSDDDDDDDDNDISDVGVTISLPPSLIQDKLKASQARGEKLRMSFIVQRFDVLFSGQPSSDNTSAVGSLIVSAALGDEEIVNLTEHQRIRTVFFVNQTKKGTPRCVFWDFDLKGGKGGWSGRGCTLLNITGQEGYYECSCNHLTNFAVLIDYGGEIDEVHNTVLTVITIIGLSLSIIGLSLTVITFLLFRKLRQGNNQKTLFNLALALLAAWILFLVGIILTQEKLHNQHSDSSRYCLVVAVLLHYFLLASFMWMLAEAVLQYLRFVKILGTYIPYFIIKASFIAWGVPLIPVIVVLSINYNLYYRHEAINVTKFCWMDQYTSYFAFLLPVGLIILVNLVVFILIIWTICTRPKGLQTNQSKTKSTVVSVQAGIACFVLLGLTWVFGFLAIENARLVFQYIFTILNSFHGFFIFLFFTLREKKVRQQWRALCCKETARKKAYGSSETNSNSNKHSGSDDTTFNSTSHTVVNSGGKFKRINSSGDSVERSKPSQESMAFMNNQ